MKTARFNIPDDRNVLYEVIHYPAGEIQVRLTKEGMDTLNNKDAYEITANPIPDIVELAQLKDAIDNIRGPIPWWNTRLFLPYLPYARADRRFVSGDSHGLKVFATLLNSLEFDAIDTFDVHSPAALGYIPKLINLDPIHAYDQITDVIKNIGEDGLCLISPDKGALGRYDLKAFDIPILTGEKVRDPKTGSLSGFSINPAIRNFKKALIVDDICDGGGTFIGLGQEIHKQNSDIELSLYVSHGVFSKGFEELDKQFKHIYISDFSIKNEANKIFEKLTEVK